MVKEVEEIHAELHLGFLSETPTQEPESPVLVEREIYVTGWWARTQAGTGVSESAQLITDPGKSGRVQPLACRRVAEVAGLRIHPQRPFRIQSAGGSSTG